MIDLALEAACDKLGALRDPCAYAVLAKGKRLRPKFALLVAESLDPAVDATPAAVAVEFVHTASLIADDLPCMDDDDQRRGQPALHRAYGESTAILASYALIAAAYEQLLYFPVIADALQLMSRCVGGQGLQQGQYFDLHAPQTCPQLLAELKTGTLFELAIGLGWLIGGGDPSRLETIHRLGCHVGALFQAFDDATDGEPQRSSSEIEGQASAAKEIADELGLAELLTLVNTTSQRESDHCSASSHV